MFNHILSIFVSVLLMGFSQIAISAPYSVTWTSTLSGSSTSPYNAGEMTSITFWLDNGGTTNVSQTWNAVDVVRVIYVFNDAPNTITTMFDPNSTDGLSDTSGSFATDAAGVLISSPTSWNDTSASGTVVSSNDPAGTTAFRWWVNGANQILVNDTADPFAEASANAVGTNITAAAWSNPVPAGEPQPQQTNLPVPTTSTWALVLLTALVGLMVFANRRRLF